MKDKINIRYILELSLPVITEMTIYTLMWMLDILLIGRYGGNFAVSIVGISDEILYTFTDIFITMGISVGINSLVARNIGGHKNIKASRYSSIGFNLGFIISISVCLIMFLFCDKLLVFTGAKASFLSAASFYLKLSLPGIFFSMLIGIICSILRGHGDTKTPCLIAFIVASSKLLLDLILIFKTPLGIYGAAVATIVSQTLGFFILYKIINFKIIYSIDFLKLKELLLLSIPSSFEEAAFSISRLLSTFMIMNLGTIPFAANQIATSIESISFMPGLGFSVATSTIIGFCVGGKNFKKAKNYTYIITALTTIMMLICSIIFIVMPKILVSFFIHPEEIEVIHLATQCLILAAFEQPPMAIYMILGAALKGAGDTKTPFIVSFISSWGIRLPLMYYFIYSKKYAITFVWWITALQWTFSAILLYFLFVMRNQKNNEPIC